MTALRILPLFLALAATPTFAFAPSGENWFTILSPHFRVHHTAPLETYARSITNALERALPELEKRMQWKAPAEIDVIVMDSSDSANGLAMNFPNTHIELFSVPFNSDSPLTYYVDWANELAIHELTHIVANDSTLGFYKNLRSIFGSWVKPNGLQPVWISEGLGVYQETSLSRGGRGRSPLLEALLREAVFQNKLNSRDYISLDRFNDSVPWWPGGSTQYLLGYTIQAIPSRNTPNLPGKLSHENAQTVVFAPDRALRSVIGKDWTEVWGGAESRLRERYSNLIGPELSCELTESGRFTGGQALSADGWIYFSEEDWNYGFHLARVRADAPCKKADIERLQRKRYSGPTQVAISPSGKKVAYAAFDPGYENNFSDLYIWNSSGGVDRLTKDERARDPAFLSENKIIYIRANSDTTQSLMESDLEGKTKIVLYTARPLERLSGLTTNGGRIFFSLHRNNGHEKIYELAHGAAVSLIPEQHSTREFERNPFVGSDGAIYFAASYGQSPQEIYRFLPGQKAPERILNSRNGFLDRPILLQGSKTVLVQAYGLNGLNLVRAPLSSSSVKSQTPKEDLHEFLTGEKPGTTSSTEHNLLPSVPYGLDTNASSLWPHYWFPEISAAQKGFLAGASTGGNDALNYHQYFLSAQYDSRANFPIYRASYHNRSSPTNFHFEASQANNYFLSRETSNRNATYSIETILPLWDFSFSFGTAYRERELFGTRSSNALVYQTTEIDRSGKTPSAITPNWGASFKNFIAAYPSSKNEINFFDVRPELQIFFRGLHPSHSVSVSGFLGLTTNRYLASNYYQGGGPSPLSPSSFIVRGYPNDALFGQRILTTNFAYTLPLAHISHGLGTNPIFLENLGLRLAADAGSANYMAIYSGQNFQYYEAGQLGRRMLYGFGGELLATGSIFYHVPVTLVAGIHYGPTARYGGGSEFYSALTVGIDRGTLRASSQFEAGPSNSK